VLILVGFINLNVHEAQAESGFDRLNEAFVSDVSQLPAVDDSRLSPDRAQQSSGHIRAWIDIVGFREIARMNISGAQTDYINGTPSDFAVVRYDVWGVGSACGYIIKKSVNTYTSGDKTVSVLKVELTWYSLQCTKSGCTCVEHKDYASFSDSEHNPVQYPTSSIPQITLHRFENCTTPRLEVFTDDTITSFNVTTKNGSVSRHMQTGQVMYSPKGVPYANFTKNYPVWMSSGMGIYRQADDIVFDDMNFTFIARTPFSRVGGNLTTINETHTKMSPLNIVMFFMLLIGFGACWLAAKMVRW
jgi:hypothetical protein